MRGISLRAKFLIGTEGLVMLLGLAIVIFVQTTLSQKFLANLQEKGIYIAKDLADESVNLILAENTLALQILIYDHKSFDEDIEYIFILDSGREVLAHTFKEGFPVDLRETNIVRSGQKYSIQSLITEKGAIYDVAIPILESRVGIVHVGISEENIRKNIANILRLIIGIVLAVLVFGVGGAFVLASIITKPIFEISQVAKAVGSGDLELKVRVRTKDEIGQLGVIFNKMITDRKQAEETLKRSEERYRTLLESISDSVYVMDREWRLILANDATADFVKMPKERLIGSKLTELFPGIEKTSFFKTYERVMEKRKPDTVVGEYTFEDGPKRWFEVHVYPIPEGILCISRDITDRKLAKDEADDIFNLSPNMIAVCTTEGEFLKLNPAWEKILGYTKKELFELGWSNLVHPDDVEKTNKKVEKQLKGSTVVNFVNRYKHKDGSYKTFEWQASFVKEGIVHATARDITEHKKTEKLRVAKEAAEATSQAKSDFLASMSHELRTPLNAIIGFSEVMRDQYFGKLNEKQSEYINDILDSGKHLLTLVNDVLDLSQVELGKSKLELSLVDVKEFLENSLIVIKEKCLEHGISLDLHIPQELTGVKITADERKLKQVMFNLLSNAVKFSHDGGSIEVEARQQRKELVISISDTGIGISPKHQERIFEEFYQIEDSLHEKIPGTGLGLSLSKRFVEAHGGRIWMESKGEGKGSRFCFTVPLKSMELKQ